MLVITLKNIPRATAAWWNPILGMHRFGIERHGEYVYNVINPNLKACEHVIEIENSNLRA